MLSSTLRFAGFVSTLYMCTTNVSAATAASAETLEELIEQNCVGFYGYDFAVTDKVKRIIHSQHGKVADVGVNLYSNAVKYPRKLVGTDKAGKRVYQYFNPVAYRNRFTASEVNFEAVQTTAPFQDASGRWRIADKERCNLRDAARFGGSEFGVTAAQLLGQRLWSNKGTIDPSVNMRVTANASRGDYAARSGDRALAYLRTCTGDQFTLNFNIKASEIVPFQNSARFWTSSRIRSGRYTPAFQNGQLGAAVYSWLIGKQGDQMDFSTEGRRLGSIITNDRHNTDFAQLGDMYRSFEGRRDHLEFDVAMTGKLPVYFDVFANGRDDSAAAAAGGRVQKFPGLIADDRQAGRLYRRAADGSVVPSYGSFFALFVCYPEVKYHLTSPNSRGGRSWADLIGAAAGEIGRHGFRSVVTTHNVSNLTAFHATVTSTDLFKTMYEDYRGTFLNTIQATTRAWVEGFTNALANMDGGIKNAFLQACGFGAGQSAAESAAAIKRSSVSGRKFLDATGIDVYEYQNGFEITFQMVNAFLTAFEFKDGEHDGRTVLSEIFGTVGTDKKTAGKFLFMWSLQKLLGGRYNFYDAMTRNFRSEAEIFLLQTLREAVSNQLPKIFGNTFLAAEVNRRPQLHINLFTAVLFNGFFRGWKMQGINGEFKAAFQKISYPFTDVNSEWGGMVNRITADQIYGSRDGTNGFIAAGNTWKHDCVWGNKGNSASGDGLRGMIALPSDRLTDRRDVLWFTDRNSVVESMFCESNLKILSVTNMMGDFPGPMMNVAPLIGQARSAAEENVSLASGGVSAFVFTPQLSYPWRNLFRFLENGLDMDLPGTANSHPKSDVFVATLSRASAGAAGFGGMGGAASEPQHGHHRAAGGAHLRGAGGRPRHGAGRKQGHGAAK